MSVKRTPTVGVGIAKYYLEQSADGLSRVEANAVRDELDALVARIAELEEACQMAADYFQREVGGLQPEERALRAALKGKA